MNILNNDLTNIDSDDIYELMNNSDSCTHYQVWAIGRDEDNNVVENTEFLLCDCDDPDTAVEYATSVTLADIIFLADHDGFEYEDSVEAVSYIAVEVETVVDYDNDSVNSGTIYRRLIDLSDDSNIITLASDEYETLRNGNIQIPHNILGDYNEGDSIIVIFDGISKPITYKIISQNEDGYVCEFV